MFHTSTCRLGAVEKRPAGRYAPSPSGDLHLGNLRTALLAWMFARTTDRAFMMRVEDLDRVRPGSEQRQLDDLATLGIDWDRPVMRQSQRLPHYDAVINGLRERGLTYECFCTRREILEAPTAPHAAAGAYPGTCRDLSTSARQAKIDAGRPPAIRLRCERDEFTVTDVIKGVHTGVVDDFVLRRGDGIAAYNLAVVIDDHAQGVDQVVRGDDLLSSAPRQSYLAELLGLPAVTYAHVPLVVNTEGKRLAKRDGAVTLDDLATKSVDAHQVLSLVAESLGLGAPGEEVSAQEMLSRFDPRTLPKHPWRIEPAELVEKIKRRREPPAHR
ncbi:tRNA glutamyl-Q(34) synthetase GluQRS [Williamsia sp. 1135]|nr:tRNA glutamyl-Q(34) synthetase GluQRS [Williamsia sp. 1135]